uniref:Uncharacterized protein n=1 Tax=Ditylenchus dipsaci TaxID=166011 RepID=A0A915EN88_9BILA
MARSTALGLNSVNFAYTSEYLGYFERTNIRRKVRGVSTEKLFPIAHWNCHVAALNELAHTKNHLEGWHKGFNERFGRDQIPLSQFILRLKAEEEETRKLVVRAHVEPLPQCFEVVITFPTRIPKKNEEYEKDSSSENNNEVGKLGDFLGQSSEVIFNAGNSDTDDPTTKRYRYVDILGSRFPCALNAVLMTKWNKKWYSAICIERSVNAKGKKIHQSSVR